jgi:hypothetical protein
MLLEEYKTMNIVRSVLKIQKEEEDAQELAERNLLKAIQEVLDSEREGTEPGSIYFVLEYLSERKALLHIRVEGTRKNVCLGEISLENGYGILRHYFYKDWQDPSREFQSALSFSAETFREILGSALSVNQMIKHLGVEV